ncbi:hypothetical protein [Mucilaginibacter sp. UYCu711]|uniref:hypothetical protein n=1 Tax=Mucilaginibacter sp. UYCu711 TaxID=3156339 RepID=UPI003D1C2528
MKKLRLKALSLGAREILNRDQLRRITGGCSTDYDCGTGYTCTSLNECASSGSGSGTGSGNAGCTGDCPPTTNNGIPQCMTAQCDATGNFVGCVHCDDHI